MSGLQGSKREIKKSFYVINIWQQVNGFITWLHSTPVHSPITHWKIQMKDGRTGLKLNTNESIPLWLSHNYIMTFWRLVFIISAAIWKLLISNGKAQKWLLSICTASMQGAQKLGQWTMKKCFLMQTLIFHNVHKFQDDYTSLHSAKETVQWLLWGLAHSTSP